jgi:hypothetical protein
MRYTNIVFGAHIFFIHDTITNTWALDICIYIYVMIVGGEIRADNLCVTILKMAAT